MSNIVDAVERLRAQTEYYNAAHPPMHIDLADGESKVLYIKRVTPDDDNVRVELKDDDREGLLYVLSCQPNDADHNMRLLSDPTDYDVSLSHTPIAGATVWSTPREVTDMEILSHD